MTDIPSATSNGNNLGNGTGNHHSNSLYDGLVNNGLAREHTGKMEPTLDYKQTVEEEKTVNEEQYRQAEQAARAATSEPPRRSFPGSRSIAPSPLRAVPVDQGFRHDLGAQVCFNPAKELEPRIARLEDEMETARRHGVFGLMRLRYEAWLEERMVGPAVRKLQARQAVLEQQVKTAEAEIRLKVTVQSGEVGAQRHKIEWNEVNRQRLAGELQALGMITLSSGQAAPASSLSSSPPPVGTHVTDEQVEAVALRGFLQGVETEEDWLVYRAELAQHLSPYAVEEVGSRLRELWRLNRQAGAGV